MWDLFRILTDETRSRRIRGAVYEGGCSSASSQAVKLNGFFLLKIVAAFSPDLFVGPDRMLGILAFNWELGVSGVSWFVTLDQGKINWPIM